MKSFVIWALLLILHRNALATEDTTSAPPTDSLNYSPRLLVTPKVGGPELTGNPVELARKLLFELELFNLIGEVVQAKFTSYDNSQRLLFEMANALQAQEVHQTADSPDCNPCISQTKDDFFDPQIEFRMG
ncbi:hypothetical protein ACLKA7_004824 [Drosophila subpalustris]